MWKETSQKKLTCVETELYTNLYEKRPVASVARVWLQKKHALYRKEPYVCVKRDLWKEPCCICCSSVMPEEAHTNQKSAVNLCEKRPIKRNLCKLKETCCICCSSAIAEDAHICISFNIAATICSNPPKTTHKHTIAHTHTHTHTHLHIHAHAHAHARTHTHTNACVRAHGTLTYKDTHTHIQIFPHYCNVFPLPPATTTHTHWHIRTHTRKHIHIHTYSFSVDATICSSQSQDSYGLAMISRLLKTIGLFCRILSLL